MYRFTLLCITATAALAACTPASEHARDVAAANSADDKLTVGVVQREIHVGMTGSDVASVLGSPNVVTSNSGGGETWIYDKISTQSAYSGSSGGVNALFLAGVGANAAASATTQRTLTVIVKYDATGRVSDFSYRQSSF
ncbi:hypothetical protein [Oceanicella sp. SM1341]|uniref:hypothetical protein n=1 Tax=Oceanicella sp. SM1341 TaxID=1548889 RepID=UPI000E4739A3|nr:hypothetical protein [Oceanicella sp. SM1341]